LIVSNIMSSRTTSSPKKIVVIGNGMVGHRFCERLIEFDAANEFQIVTFCEEPRVAYDRVGLTKYFEHRDAEKLGLTTLEWYRENGIEIHVGERAESIDRERKEIRSTTGRIVPYDYAVLATGSSPFVPPIPGVDKKGVFVYRTIEDLESIIEFGGNTKTAAVIGGGLLGLEAAKAAFDLGLETHVVEFATRLMPRQVDDRGSSLLARKIEELGVQVHLSRATEAVTGNGVVEGLSFQGGESLDVGMVIVSAGIRPRDELARDCGLEVGERGGVAVNDALETSDASIFAIGEVALHRGMVYGLVAPGYEMADVVAANLTGSDREFDSADLSTKLKLMGVDVASFGEYDVDESEIESGNVHSIVFEDPVAGVYKKLLVDRDGTRLLGGILVGDTSDYGRLLLLSKSVDPLPCKACELIVGSSDDGAAGGLGECADDVQVCACNGVAKGVICSVIRDRDLTTLGEVKSCTNAGTGCGGCLALVNDLLTAELEATGQSISSDLCEHFAYTRQDLFAIVKVHEIRSFDELIERYGSGNGCEICKPAAASILASLWNEDIMEHTTLQDTNDRFLANMQRGGLYSIVPRVPGGEITPEKLIVLGEVAKEHGLYTKITGGQRVDLFGAQAHQLPEIWEKLIAAGFESGHAYGKALRTVKSCVGTTWCRFGVQDSVSFAIRVEERYRGIRAPHKIKSAVSACVRECAEAQSKDFGMVATENGYALYVCGNGGAKPRHADLLASDLDEETCIRYIDRFLMYYIMTADKLTRTSVWLEKLEGGIDHLREVVIDDKLGICDELEERMQHLVDTYECEWKRVVEDPEKRKLFQQFVNTDETEAGIELVPIREQSRPADWPKDVIPIESVTLSKQDENERRWVQVGKVWDFPEDGGGTVKYGATQIAVFHFASRGEWFATQNRCPHKNAFVLSRGIVGDAGGVPKVACPLHKKTFDLSSGECTSGDDFSIDTFEVKVDGDDVSLLLPSIEVLDRVNATDMLCVSAVIGCTAHT